MGLYRYDLAPAILDYVLPSQAEQPSKKKQKTNSNEETIAGRLAANHYDSTDALVSDLRLSLDGLKSKDPQNQAVEEVEEVLSQYSHGFTKSQSLSLATQVLTVRSSVDGGPPKQLFTGLRLAPSNQAKVEEIDVRKLPNGFDVVEAASLPVSGQLETTDRRTFGDVFRQQRNTRQLELPKPARTPQSPTLRFSNSAGIPEPVNKDDYRVAPLSAGSWLQYSAAETNLAQPPDHSLKLSQRDAESLFNASFSSFAPSEDNTTAIVPRLTRARLWYRKHGPASLNRILPISEQKQDDLATEYPEIDDDFQKVIDDFVPARSNDPLSDLPTADKDADQLLEEVSELLSTLASHQQLRDLDKIASTPAQKNPEKDEVDVFELLRLQLKTLVASLPPYATAKLDGKQLNALNISTKILVQTPDVAGTGQPDDGTLHRQRLSQAQQTAMSRPVNPTPVRNSYANIPPSNYNPQMRSYVHPSQAPSLPGYAQRNSMYTTPRQNVVPAGSYNQASNYTRNTQPYPGATIQQYQRLQNGYNANAQTPYQQRTAQTPYHGQNNMQNTPIARSASPAKPLVNGQQTPQTQAVQAPRNQYTTPAPSTSLLSGAYAQANVHATIQQLKAHQQSQSPQPMQGVQQNNVAAVQAQRQASGTPQPPGTVNGSTQNVSQSATVTPQPVTPAGVDATRA